jgi:hypothetical protein
MRPFVLAGFVLIGLLVGPDRAGAQPYSQDAAFGTLYTSFGLLQALASGAAEANTFMSRIGD